MNYKTEFPDYDRILYVPKGFTDCSYHNDICPRACKIFSKNDTEVVISIWQDYKDATKREYSEGKRYILSIDIESDTIFSYPTDNWEEIERLLPCISDMQGWKDELHFTNQLGQDFIDELNKGSSISLEEMVNRQAEKEPI